MKTSTASRLDWLWSCMDGREEHMNDFIILLLTGFNF